MPKKRQYKRLWRAVKRLILEHHETLLTRSIRGSYYIIGDYLGKLIRRPRAPGEIELVVIQPGARAPPEDITLEDYNWYGTKQGYASYRDDIWPRMEQKHGLQRPEAAPIGVVYDNGTEYPVTHLEAAWDQARGFIFVEKADEARALRPLSEYGWTITAGRGYPTRLVRKLLKEDTRQVLVLHDWDPDGGGIYRALGFETRRTWHLDIEMGDQVTDLGLSAEHVKRLELPTRPSPSKYKGRPRVELSALEVLSVRMDLENPVLAYTVASMLAKGLTLSPTEKPKEEMAAEHLRWALTRGIRGVVSKVVKEIMGDTEIEGEAVSGALDFSKKIEMPGLHKALKTTGKNILGEISWKTEADYVEEALELFANEELVRLLAE